MKARNLLLVEFIPLGLGLVAILLFWKYRYKILALIVASPIPPLP